VTKPCTFRLPEDVMQAIDDAAWELKITRSKVIVRLLRDALERSGRLPDRLLNKHHENDAQEPSAGGLPRN